MDNYLKIATDFSDTPGPRYEKEGSFSGEVFRERILYARIKECIQSNSILYIDLDGTQGYGTSFLEEAFGGLIRENSLSYDEIVKYVKIISNEEPYLLDDIEQYLQDAQKDEK